VSIIVTTLIKAFNKMQVPLSAPNKCCKITPFSHRQVDVSGLLSGPASRENRHTHRGQRNLHQPHCNR